MKDIDQIRRDNMTAIERELGGTATAAERSGMSQSQWSNLRSGAADSKTGKPRGMRKDTARRIEQAAGKPSGWLDIDHEESIDDTSSSSAVANETRAQYQVDSPLQPDERALVDFYRKMNAEDRKKLLNYLEIKAEIDQFPLEPTAHQTGFSHATDSPMMRDVSTPSLGTPLVDLTGT